MMNKVLLTLALIVFGAFLITAQIKVVAPNGHVGMGVDNPSEKLEVEGNVRINGEEYNEGFVCEKTGASASASFTRSNYSAFALGAGVQAGFKVDEDYHLEFRSGPRTDVESKFISTGNLLLRFQKNTGDVGIGVGSPAEKLHVNGNIQAGTVFYASDKRLKKNINKFSYGLDQVLQLDTKTFDYHTMNKSSTSNSNVGIIAQDLQAIAPELVSTFVWEEEDNEGNVVSSNEYLRINDTSIKWMLVNAIQEQQELLDAKDQAIADLESRLDQLEDLVNAQLEASPSQDAIIEGQSNLKQNEPNPFNGLTSINYSVPTNSDSAILSVTDINGKVIKNIPLAIVQNGNVDLKIEGLTSGTYTYSLVIDGVLYETKKMIISQ